MIVQTFIIVYLSGILANVGAETLSYGPVSPFVVALFPLISCGILVTSTWEENYGDRKVYIEQFLLAKLTYKTPLSVRQSVSHLF